MNRLLTSCFGLGKLPLAPGTWGSLPPVIVFMAMNYLGLNTPAIIIAMAVLAILGSLVCVRFAPSVIEATGTPDPREVVMDEFAGQAVTFLLINAVPPHAICTTAVLGFLLFRIFDVFKPYPIQKLERLPAGWGVLADDLLAGTYAALALFLYHKFRMPDPSCLSLFDGKINLVLAALLGAVQGLTEFLPVSSSGHLVLCEKLFGLKPDTPAMLLFDLTIHVATLVAIVIIFRSSFVAFLKNLLAFRKYGHTPRQIYRKSPSVHFTVLAVAATFVTAALGFWLRDRFEAARGSLMLIAWLWVIMGTLLLITDLRKKTRLSLRRFGIFAAAMVGLAQAIALLPGISRSGATICTAVLIGLHRRWAVEFSFLLAVPAILGATLITVIKDSGQILAGALPLCPVLVGMISACITGILALKLLIRASRKAKLKYFAIYCYILAGFVGVYLLSAG